MNKPIAKQIAAITKCIGGSAFYTPVRKNSSMHGFVVYVHAIDGTEVSISFPDGINTSVYVRDLTARD